jgi:hypothetical protein
MNVNNRKLFANRDARRRLAEMGGIVNAYPELMGVAQQFEPGGMVRPVYETGVTPFNIIAERAPGMSQQEQIEAGLPRAGLPRREVLEIMGRVDPNIGPEEFSAMNREERRAAGFSGLGSLNNAYFNARERMLESQFPMQGPAMPPAPGRQLASEEFINPADEFAGLTPDMADPFQLPEMVFDREEPAPVLGGQGSAEGFDLFDMAEGQEEEAPAAEVRAPDEGTPRPVLRPDRPVAETESGEQVSGTRPVPRPQNVIDAAAKAIEEDGGNDPSGASATSVLDSLTGGAANTVSGRVQQYEQLFQEMFGESDEDKTRERYMNLAMIGFAIASGEDPSALRNIASGMLQGTAQMREDAAVRRQRQDRIKELAVAAGLEDDRLARTLAGNIAEASIRAAGTERTPLTDDSPEDFYNKNFATAIAAARSDEPPIDMREGEDPVRYATRIARLIQPIYGGRDEAAEAAILGTPSPAGAPSGMTEDERALFEGL